MGISSVLGTGALVPAGYGFRNLVINGAMQVAQRGTSASSKTTTGYYTADRWSAGISSLGTWTQSVENDAPTGSGFRKSLKMLCTTADASPAAGDYAAIQQMIEGQNLQVVKKGTSSAEQLTVTFWVKSNVTGTYIFELYDGDNTRQVSASYTVDASATWEKKTIVIPADTTGAFDNDNALSLYVIWWLAAGSNFTSGTLNTTWASATSANRVVGQTNLAAATNNYWQITGVQLEVGPVATAYEFKPIDVEIAQCQRYYSKTYNITVSPGTNTNTGMMYGVGAIISTTTVDPLFQMNFIATMRTAPTVKLYANDGTADNFVVSGTKRSSAVAWIGEHGGAPYTTALSGATVGQAVVTYGHYTADAEL